MWSYSRSLASRPRIFICLSQTCSLWPSKMLAVALMQTVATLSPEFEAFKVRSCEHPILPPMTTRNSYFMCFLMIHLVASRGISWHIVAVLVLLHFSLQPTRLLIASFAHLEGIWENVRIVRGGNHAVCHIRVEYC